MRHVFTTLALTVAQDNAMFVCSVQALGTYIYANQIPLHTLCAIKEGFPHPLPCSPAFPNLFW